MKTIFAAVLALTVALVGASGAAPAWAGGERPSVFPQPVDPWRNWDRSAQGAHGRFHGGGHFNGGHFKGHPGHGVSAPGGPRVVPGYFVWNGYAWVWVPAYWAR